MRLVSDREFSYSEIGSTTPDEHASTELGLARLWGPNWLMQTLLLLLLLLLLQVNHLPCSFQLGRKDRLWKNLLKMQQVYGKKDFDFIPQTFCLPGDLEALRKVWDEEGMQQKWILKPVSELCVEFLHSCDLYYLSF
ncbi:unnamed protein product [Protopolystoma xenopodis]|uniref:Uncharacterized protein n=1 Tax=Protopolystoma xenopodis TaxID=117903 RepID=A0A3S5C583_9PLAT|nr:unnamed protein product [Protopolystoma xenopodis]